MRFSSLASATALICAALYGAAAHAQDKQAPVPFAGGQLTVTQTEDYGEKTLAFDGKELAHNYVVYFDRIAKVDGTDVALFDVGDGGNACGPAKLMVWKPQNGGIETDSIGEDDCGAPVMAVNENQIYFVPWLMPGGSAPVKTWSPSAGFALAGTLTYTPDPGTGWEDIDASKYDNIIDAFHNEAVYTAATKLLGDRLTDVTTALLVGGGTEKTASGIIYASGCVPHACGGSDGFMAIDAGAQKLYFAQENEKGADAWPTLKTWPADLRAAMKKAFAPPQ
ncbi:hypothetical protein [Mesorhizobium sp. A556]